MFRRCPKVFQNNYNCINHIGVTYGQYPFKDILVVTKKHDQDIVKIARKLEDLLTKHQKNALDIKFMKTCKRENLTPTFSTINLAIKH